MMVTPPKFSMLKTPAFILVALATLLVGVLAGVLWQKQYQNQLDLLSKPALAALEASLAATREKYRLAVGTEIEISVMQPEVLDRMAAALDAPTSDWSAIRAPLAGLLAHAHERVLRFGGHQFQLNLADDRTLYRFHRPDFFGDPLLAIRPALALANQQREPVSGIEGGRSGISYRYVFPLFQGERRLGNVEVGLPVEAIVSSLNRLRPDAVHLMLFSHAESAAKLSADRKDKYLPWAVDPAWTTTRPDKDAATRAYQASALATRMQPLFAADPRLKAALARGETFSLPFAGVDEGSIASFVALHDVTDRHIGYLLSLEAAPEIGAAHRSFLTFAATGVLMLALLGLAALLLLQARQRQRAHLEQLQQAHRYQEAIVANLLDGVITIDGMGMVLTFSPAAERIFGYAADEVVGRNIRMLMPEPYHSAHDGYLAAYRETGRKTIIGSGGREVEGRRKNGECFPLDLGVAEMPLDGMRQFVGVVRDISTRRAMEMELRSAKTRAEAATQAKSQFLANMSHEIRTPMNAILGLTRAVMESDLKPEQREQLAKVNKSGRALVRIINDILDFSRIEAGRLAIEKVPMRVETALMDVADLFGAQVEEKGLELFLEIDPDTPLRVLGDPLRLTQVLNNLVGNAVKFTPHGEIHLSVRVQTLGDASSTLRFCVRDTGIGIAPELLSHLCQPFTQADDSTTRKFGGSGLGLSIASRLVELMGGKLTLESQPGRGTQASFHIEVGMVPEELRNVAHLGHDLQQMRGRRVLVVDDQSTSRMILASLLGAWGLEAVQAASGPEALLRVAQAESAGHPMDTILLDWRMPGMDGLQVAAALKAREAAGEVLSPLQILMVTAYDKTTLMQQPEAECIQGVLAKPVVPSFLFDALLHGNTRQVDAGDTLIAQRFDGLTVLLVEDNDLNQEVAANFMTKRGVIVTLAWNGQEAVDWVSKQRFDVVLMDLHMPVMGGIAATRRIRELPQGRHLPIVAMTAAVQEEDRKSCQEAGMVDFIAKPVEPEDLVRVLARYSRSGGVATPGAAAPAAVTEAPLLDLERALRRLDGDQALQQRLLLGFVERHHDLSGRLDGLLAQADTAAAIDLVHSLKGIAANLGAVALAEACRRLIEELRAGIAPDSRAAFDSCLKDTLRSMQQHINATVEPVMAPVGAVSLTDTLLALTPYVRSQEVVPDELQAALQQLAADAPRLQALNLHLNNFEHDEALALLEQLNSDYGVGA